ncbi:AP-4 complex subunit sigma-1 [Mactra antiquata]
MILYIMVVNYEGHVLFARYYQHYSTDKRVQLQNEVISLCKSRTKDQSSILDYEDYTLVYHKLSTVTFISGITQDENELAVLELFRHFCKILISHFGSLIFYTIFVNPFLLLLEIVKPQNEMISNGRISETSQARVLAPLQLMATAKR